MNWTLAGRCWKFGDDVGIDGDMMPLGFALARETDPQVLAQHLMTGLDPDFPQKARPGDILVAGRRFGQGNPHIQGFLGIRGAGLGLVAESIPRGSFRNAVNAGVRFLTGCTGVTGACDTGDLLEVDFRAGTFVNRTRGTRHQFTPLDAPLLDIVALGGWRAHFERRVAQMRAAQAR